MCIYLLFLIGRLIFCFNIQVALVIFLFINSCIFLIYFIMYKLTPFCFSVKKIHYILNIFIAQTYIL